MPKPLTEYTAADWSHLRPVLHGIKRWRYARVTDAYVQQPARRGDVAALRTCITGRRLLTTIAFNDPEIVERQLLAVRRFVPGPIHLIADNSQDDALARDIEAICEALGAPYLRLPANPWTRRESASRSHGAALDWIWRQLVQPGRPDAFGFLDHDLIPTAPCDPFEPLARQPVHGDKRWAGPRWFLWAGYCFFRTDFLDRTRVDFSQDWFAGLDTGGGNWEAIYSRMDPEALEERPISRIAIVPQAPVDECYVERRGCWLHEVGFDDRPDLKAEKRAGFLAMVDAAIGPPT